MDNTPQCKTALFKTFLIAGEGSCPEQRSGLPQITSLTEFPNIIMSRRDSKASAKCMWFAILQARTRQVIKALNIFSETWLNKSPFKSTFAQSKSILTYRYSHRRERSKREFLWRLLHTDITDIQVRHSFFLLISLPLFNELFLHLMNLIILHVKLAWSENSSSQPNVTFLPFLHMKKYSFL